MRGSLHKHCTQRIHRNTHFPGWPIFQLCSLWTSEQGVGLIFEIGLTPQREDLRLHLLHLLFLSILFSSKPSPLLLYFSAPSSVCTHLTMIHNEFFFLCNRRFCYVTLTASFLWIMLEPTHCDTHMLFGGWNARLSHSAALGGKRAAVTMGTVEMEKGQSVRMRLDCRAGPC